MSRERHARRVYRKRTFNARSVFQTSSYVRCDVCIEKVSIPDIILCLENAMRDVCIEKGHSMCV